MAVCGPVHPKWTPLPTWLNHSPVRRAKIVCTATHQQTITHHTHCTTPIHMQLSTQTLPFEHICDMRGLCAREPTMTSSSPCQGDVPYHTTLRNASQRLLPSSAIVELQAPPSDMCPNTPFCNMCVTCHTAPTIHAGIPQHICEDVRQTGT
jgi:hypothetical protein